MTRLRMFSVLVALISFGCSGKDEAGSAETQVTLIGSDSAGQPLLVSDSVAVSEGECVHASESLCVVPDTSSSDWCEREGGPVDVVLVKGEVVQVVCYPPAENPDRPVVTVNAATQGDIDLVQTANNTTVVFNEELDGKPFVGDMSIDGNNVAIYGNGMDKTIIDGDVTIDGNNVRLRGVTITGDLHIGLNTASVVMSRVLGNVTIEKNNAVLVGNEVFGSVSVTMNNATLVDNDVQGDWAISGHNHTCDLDHAFSDANNDQLIQDTELSGGLSCP